MSDFNALFIRATKIPYAKVGEDTSFKQRVKIAVTVIAHGSDLKTKMNKEVIHKSNLSHYSQYEWFGSVSIPKDL